MKSIICILYLFFCLNLSAQNILSISEMKDILYSGNYKQDEDVLNIKSYAKTKAEKLDNGGTAVYYINTIPHLVAVFLINYNNKDTEKCVALTQSTTTDYSGAYFLQLKNLGYTYLKSVLNESLGSTVDIYYNQKANPQTFQISSNTTFDTNMKLQYDLYVFAQNY